MSDTKHTPEPWEIVGRFSDKIYHAPSDTVVAQSWYPGASSISPADTMIANARRIVACVNACAGMTDPAAEIAALRAELERKDARIRELETHINEHYTGAATAYIKELETNVAELSGERDEWKVKAEEGLSLVDGAMSTVELYGQQHKNYPAMVRWASDWLARARAAIEEE